MPQSARRSSEPVLRVPRPAVRAAPLPEVYPEWRSLAAQEQDLFHSGKYLDRLCARKAHYEHHIGARWWGAAALADFLQLWKEERESFRAIVHGARRAPGKEHPRVDLLALVDNMFRS